MQINSRFQRNNRKNRPSGLDYALAYSQMPTPEYKRNLAERTRQYNLAAEWVKMNEARRDRERKIDLERVREMNRERERLERQDIQELAVAKMMRDRVDDQQSKNELDYRKFIKNPDEKECNICFDSIDIDDAYIRKCGHWFHKDCISIWNSKNRTCPNCRQAAQRRRKRKISSKRQKRRKSRMTSIRKTRRKTRKK